VNRVRRIVCADGPGGKSRAIEDGSALEQRTDPEQAGVVSTLIWATDRTPAWIATRMPRVADSMEPPPGGSVCRVVAYPPYAPPSPPMRRTRTLDFCLVLEGEITLILDTEEVRLAKGDTVVQRGTRHAWSNRSSRPCVLAISSHDASD
jgi:mannose-6-phosphate isomerase-like protein (cupin superfamily)